jgi:predicted HTH domain antitoxin
MTASHPADPDQLQVLLSQAGALAHDDTLELLQATIDRDRQQSIEHLLLEALDSPASPLTQDDWKTIRTRVRLDKLSEEPNHGAWIMQITIDLPDHLSLTEAEVRTELAIALFQRDTLLIEQAAQLTGVYVDDFYQILVDRQILTPPIDPDDDPDELILAHLRISLQQIHEGKTLPISQLWDGIDVWIPFVDHFS